MSGCIRTTAGVKIVCYLDSRLVFYDSDDFKSHRPAWIHDLLRVSYHKFAPGRGRACLISYVKYLYLYNRFMIT